MVVPINLKIVQYIIENTNVVESEAKNAVSNAVEGGESTTKIDDLPSGSNNNQQENVSNH